MSLQTEIKHYNDWPNTQGFDVTYEEKSPVELQVDGVVPAYAAGVLFRTGLGPREVLTTKGSTFKVNHWFDNFSQVHRFQIHAPENSNSKPRVTYNSRLTSDGLIEQIKKTGCRDGITFAANYDPCVSFFRKLQTVFTQSAKMAPNEVNIGVTMSPNFPGLSKYGQRLEKGHSNDGITTLCNKTDVSTLQMLDPETLEPIGIANQKVLHPQLKGPMSGAHAKFDPTTGDVFNYNLEFGRNGTYRLFTVSAASGKTSILASINHTPAYIHSLFLTEHYVILCVWNSFYTAGGASMLWKRNVVDALAEFDESIPTTWFVVDRRPIEAGGRGHVATYKSEPFFSFHSVNAYEVPSVSSPDGVDIVADIAAYQNLDCLKRFYIDNMLSDSASARSYSDPSNNAARPTLRRYRLPNLTERPHTVPDQAVREFMTDCFVTPELPTINSSKATKKHRFIYGIVDTGKSTFSDSLVKYDTEDHTAKIWSEHRQTAGEPIFVADPASGDEDGGVLLSVVLDGTEGKSYLLVLDAKTMNEVGRARVDGPIGFGFHGTHVSTTKVDNWGA